MAANYWATTQRIHWQFTPEELSDTRYVLEEQDRILVQQYALPDRRLVSIFFKEQLAKLGRRMNIRQQALATAQVFIRRFYTRVEIRRTNPYLILATALYLACKIEECPQHIRVVASEARSMWPDFITTDISRIGECEFHLISEMNCQLIVHHPYRTLLELQSTLHMTQEEMSLAWSIINDSYITDVPLLFAPHVMALTAISLALVLRPNQSTSASASASASASIRATLLSDATSPEASLLSKQGKVQFFSKWLAEGEADLIAIQHCSQELISLYEVWELYSEKTCKEQISRCVKARGLDK